MQRCSQTWVVQCAVKRKWSYPGSSQSFLYVFLSCLEYINIPGIHCRCRFVLVELACVFNVVCICLRVFPIVNMCLQYSTILQYFTVFYSVHCSIVPLCFLIVWFWVSSLCACSISSGQRLGIQTEKARMLASNIYIGHTKWVLICGPHCEKGHKNPCFHIDMFLIVFTIYIPSGRRRAPPGATAKVAQGPQF